MSKIGRLYRWRNTFWRTLYIIVIIFFDQLSKWWVVEKLYSNEGEQVSPFFEWLLHASERVAHAPIEITSYFNLVMVWNEGISFGLFNDGGAVTLWLFSLIALGAAVIFFVWMHRTPHAHMKTALALVIAGALGNVWDRIRFGGVADFLDFHLLDYHWPAFNIADSAITIGMIIFLYDVLVNPVSTQAKTDVDKTV